MSTSDLIDPVAVGKFVEVVHERAAASLAGMNERCGVLHLDRMWPVRRPAMSRKRNGAGDGTTSLLLIQN